VVAGPAVVHEGARTDESALLSTLKATSGWRRHAANEWLLPNPDEIVAMALRLNGTSTRPQSGSGRLRA
jgi:hypothetical protein